MDPATLMQLIARLHQQGQMSGMGQPQGQMPPMGGMMPQMGQMPQMAAPQGQMPAMAPPPDPAQGDQGKHHGGGFNPLMLLSPMGGLFASSPKTAMSLMSPAFGIANLLGAFK